LPPCWVEATIWGNFVAGVGPVVLKRVSIGADGTYDWYAGFFLAAVWLQ
jgi:hypothetical protein